MSADRPLAFERVLSGTAAERNYGYCRAIRVGDRVLVSGTTAMGPDGAVAPQHVGDTYAQTREALGRIEDALNELGLGLADVVRTTVYFTDRNGIADLIKAHGESFGPIKPASTAVGITCLFHPDLLVEIDAEAIG